MEPETETDEAKWARWERELRERNGDEWVAAHRGLLDAQREWIESL
jgi:hypothetical protein